MAESNENIVDELIKDVGPFDLKTKDAIQDDNDQFHDALEATSDCDSGSISESDSHSEVEDETKKEKIQLTEEECEEQRRNSLDLKEKGNELFRSGKHSEASKVYSKALKSCPRSFSTERSQLYNNRAAAKTKLGLKESALKDCTKAIDLNPNYAKALLRRAKLYEELDQLNQALADYQELHKIEPTSSEVKVALAALPKRIEEQNEKLKKEMLSKMKDLGNMFLKPFGLSTENFQINQNPETGSYSVNMTK